MATAARWVPDRRDIVWIDFNPQAGREMKDLHPMLVLSPQGFQRPYQHRIGHPMTTAEFNDSNPFAIKFSGPKGVVSYVLAHQPRFFDWRARAAKPHLWKQATPDVFSDACETLNQIVAIGE